MALNKLAMELLEEVGSYLPRDKDVVNFIATCRILYMVGRCGLWRKLYAQRYDLPKGMKWEEIMLKYQVRSKFLNKPFDWNSGQVARYKDHVLLVLKDLVLESYTNVPLGDKTEHISPNLLVLRRYCLLSGLLDYHHRSCLPKFNLRLKTLQLVLSHIQLDPINFYDDSFFPCSQKAVYQNPNTYPLVKGKNGGEVDITLLKHIVDFFKYHLSSQWAGTLYDIFDNLDNHLKPKAWDTRLDQHPDVSKLGKHWLGSYGHLPKVKDIRERRTNSYYFEDVLDYENGFHTLSLEFPAAAQTPAWPQAFETFLEAKPALGLCEQLDQLQTTYKHSNDPSGSDSSACPGPKLGSHYQQFRGSGRDALDFSCHGIVHPLPPQNDFPGWQRITLMKRSDEISTPGHKPNIPGLDTSAFNVLSDTTFPNINSPNMAPAIDDEINRECWCYEGVILPGGKVILGRWWSPFQDLEEMYLMGPFIYWEVGTDEEPEGMYDTSLN